MKKIYLMISMAIAFSACQEEEHVSPEPSQEVQKKAEIDPDDPGFNLAKNLSLTLQDPEVRKFIQDQAVKQFDGDYDILLAKARYESLTTSANARGAKTFGELLSGSGPNARTTGLDLDRILAENPLLQIAVPELPEASAESWDVNNYSPTVVYRIPGLDLNEVTHLPAFDSEGNAFDFDIREIPTQPIMVVSYNERLTAVPKGKSPESVINGRMACPIPSVYYSDANYDYYFTPDLYCSKPSYPSNPTPPSTGGGVTSCDRDRKSTYDHVSKIIFKTMEWFLEAEAYVDGNPEIFVLAVHGSKSPSGFNDIRKYMASPDRSKWKDCGVIDCDPEWFVANQEVLDWREEDFGNLMRYDWFEEDASGRKVTYSISFTTNFGDNNSESVTGKVEVVINSNDRNLGGSYIRYCDNTDGAGEDYDTGQIIFHLNQQ